MAEHDRKECGALRKQNDHREAWSYELAGLTYAET